MTNIFETTRFYDFKIYYKLYELGLANHNLSEFYYFFARYGIVFFFFTFIYLIYKRKIHAFLNALLAMGVAGLVDLIMYIAWRRPRPFITYASLVNPQTGGMYVDSSSFPSSHTYIVFAIATSVYVFGHKKLGVFLYILAIFVAIGRIGAGLHYPSDVIGGALLGVLSGLVVNFIFKRFQSEKLTQLSEQK